MGQGQACQLSLQHGEEKKSCHFWNSLAKSSSICFTVTPPPPPYVLKLVQG
jgi:hypothetical protein